jgi:hypothetical protein
MPNDVATSAYCLATGSRGRKSVPKASKQIKRFPFGMFGNEGRKVVLKIEGGDEQGCGGSEELAARTLFTLISRSHFDLLLLHRRKHSLKTTITILGVYTERVGLVECNVYASVLEVLPPKQTHPRLHTTVTTMIYQWFMRLRTVYTPVAVID